MVASRQEVIMHSATASQIRLMNISQEERSQGIDAIRRLVATLARSAGLSVLKEHRVGWQRTAEGPRPIHTADVSTVGPEGWCLLVDVRAMTCPPCQSLSLSLSLTFYVGMREASDLNTACLLLHPMMLSGMEYGHRWLRCMAALDMPPLF